MIVLALIPHPFESHSDRCLLMTILFVIMLLTPKTIFVTELIIIIANTHYWALSRSCYRSYGSYVARVMDVCEQCSLGG